jgi:hypothetical protein
VHQEREFGPTVRMLREIIASHALTFFDPC